MSVSAVTSRNIKLTAVFQVDGLASCWYMGATAPSASALVTIEPATGSITAYPGLNAVGSTSASISITEGVPSSSSVSVSIDVRADNNARELLRRAPAGASARTTLLTSLPGEQNTGALVIYAVDPITAFPASGVLHIGQEAVAYSIKRDAARTFTASVSSRGYLGTRIQRHLADAARSRAPRIYAECSTWTRRPARVWVGQLDDAGDWIAQPVIEAEGFISGIPQRDQFGAIEVQLETLPSALDAEFGTAALDTTLQRGWHLFDGFHANRFDAFTEIWDVGAAYDDRAQAALALGGSPIVAPTGALPGLVKASAPETMQLFIRSRPWLDEMTVTATAPGANGPDDPTGTISIAGGVPAAISINDRISNARAEYVAPYVFGTAGTASVVQWPAALDGLNAVLQADVGAATPGPWAAVTIGVDGAMVVAPQWDADAPRPLILRWLIPSTETCWALCPGSELPALTTDGVDFGDWPAFDPRPSSARRRYPRPAPAQPPQATINAGDSAAYRLTVPGAWYQPPERYLLVEDSIASGASAGSPKWVMAKHQRNGADVRSVWPVVSEALASTITALAPGYALEIREQDRVGAAVAQLEGSEPPLIRAAAAWRDESTTTIIRQALASLTGTGANGTDDVQPYGLGVPSVLIDSAAMDALDVDPIGPRTHVFDEAEDSREIISALCRSIGAVLTERLNQDTGRRMLSLEPVGLPVPQQAVQTIADGDWLVEGRPVVTEDDKVINRVAFGMQWGDPLQTTSVDDADRGGYTVGVTDMDSPGEAGGQPSSEDLPLYGLRADDDDPRQLQDLLLPIAQARFAAYGYARKVLQGQVAYSVGVTLYPGAVVTLQASDLDGYDGQPITSVTGIVVSVERDVMAQTCTIRAVYWPEGAAGWPPALLKDGALAYASGVAIPVAVNEYAPVLAPSGAAQTDVDLLRVGDAVSYVPRGDFASKVDTTISAIGTNTITVAHNVPAGAGTFRPRAYTLTTALLRAYCHMADEATLEFSNGDAAKVYS